MPETRASAREGSGRIRVLEAKQKALYAMAFKLAELSNNVSRTEDRHLFLMKTSTLQDTQAEFARVTEELMDVRSELDPEYAPSYEAFETFDELICRILFVKAEIAEDSPVKPVKEGKRAVRARLPPIELLKFSGDAAQWPLFSEIFKRIVNDNPELSDSERAHYLISQIHGEALSTVTGILPTGDNYQLMWDLLSQKYEDIRIIASTYLGQLIKFRPLTSQDTKSLNRYCNEFETAAVALKALKLPDLADFIFTHIGLSKLDQATVQNFERSLGNETPTFAILSEYVHKHCKVLTRTDAMHTRPAADKVKSHKTHILIASTDKPKPVCEFCKATGHAIYLCDRFKALNPSERLKAVRRQGLCAKCLRKHPSSQCTSKWRCKTCGKSHNSLLHLSPPAMSERDAQASEMPVNCLLAGESRKLSKRCDGNTSERDSYTRLKAERNSMFPTARVFINSQRGLNKPSSNSLRVLLDTGSGANFITKSICEKYKLKINYAPSKVFGLGGSPQNIIGYTVLGITSRFDARCAYKIRASVVLKLTDPLPSLNVAVTERARGVLKGLPLADDKFNTRSEIHCILGAALFPTLLRSRKIQLPGSNLYAVDSTLGYIVMGEASTLFKPVREVCLLAREMDADLNRRVQSFWELETVKNLIHLSPEEKACEADFEKNVTRREDGTFMVALPFKDGPAILGDSRRAAERRLTSLEKRLDINPELRAGYNATFSEYLDRGFLHKVVESAEPPQAYYIPHRAVYNPDIDTSKIRLVLDASSKSSSGKGLNDVLHCGPNLQSLRPNAACAASEGEGDVPEAKVISLSIVTQPEVHVLDELIDRVSSYDRLLNAVVYVLRFCKKLTSRGPINPADQAAAEMSVIQRVQLISFAGEIAALEQGRTCRKGVRKLSPCLIEGILCVGGRLKYSELSLRQKHPILLPGGSRVSELIVRGLHVKNFHTGPGLLLAITRNKYWILSARRLVRRVVHSCNVCFRSRPVPRQPIMGNLPKLRLQGGKSFLNAGVDYAGPIPVRMSGGRGARSTKAYICVFICLATKALHIELVSDLSTNLFIAAFKRFISRRGPVSCILSDGGRNFIGAKRKLGEIYSLVSSGEYDREVIRELTPMKTEFKTNPPLAPHFGGIWESNIKCIKTHLFRVLGTQVLTYEELNTLLVQIEAVLNSRPLCVLSDDPNEPVALTPAHFLSIQPLDYLPAQDLRDTPLARLPRHALIDRLVQSYWDRWRKEYLSSLQTREKWNVPDKPLQIGQVVVLDEPNVPTLRWPLGLVTEVFPGSDGVTRVVRVKTKGGSYVRPATRICVLPTQ